MESGGYNRHNAHEITKDNEGNPRYGGSINDQSVIRYLQELKKRGFKIMFYPMFFLDVNLKPWRGRLTGDAKEVTNFFNKTHGYNEFIIHYANLVKDYVDAFIIGSELIGLTKVKNSYNHFPAVNKLVDLAKIVKNIVGKKVLVSYAADWSEYHHKEDGWYNLDPLWASPNIDFIGIDAYFPITNLDGLFVANKDIKEGFSSGEGYDYYIDHERNKKFPLAPEFAWKNLKYWWENTHCNPDRLNTVWRPKSKKIWFTEYGFPSIDKAPNQPNVFFDPLCVDGGVPRYSNSEIDFGIQRRCIKAFIEFWSNEEYIENMFLWTWDARPYPAWPHMDVWKDGYLWEKGHWVNDKFGAASVASIILEVSHRCKIDLNNVEINTIDEALTGAFFNNQISGKDAISILRSAYFFDISASNEQRISFIKRGQLSPNLIKSDDLIKLSNTSYINEISIAKEQMITKVDIYFQTQLGDYKTNYLHINSEELSNLKNAVLRLPLIISESEAGQIGRLLLKNAAAEKMILEFNLPISYLSLEVADFISLHYQKRKYNLRIIKITFIGLIINVIAIIDEISNYHLPNFKNKINIFYQKNIETEFKIIELPFKLYSFDFPYLVAYLNSNSKLPLYIRIKQNLDADWKKIAILEPTNYIVKVIDFNASDNPDLFVIDEISTIYVRGIELEKFNDDGWKLIEINNELIAFKTINKLESEEEIYSISHLIRGVYGSEKHVKNHEVNVSATILIRNTNIIPISEELIGQLLEFRVGSMISEICFTNQANLPSKPMIISNYIKDSTLYLGWIRRNFKIDMWQRKGKENLDFSIKIKAKDQELNFATSPEINKIEIDIQDLDLSEGYIVDIM
ncbi:MAG: glycoside hydrolase TIM-barrel-like domain-containing protein [Rickettsiaceae bacterium]